MDSVAIFCAYHNTASGTVASALVYSISETAKLNNLRPYYYFKYILTELPNFCDEQGNIDYTKLDDLYLGQTNFQRNVENHAAKKAAFILMSGVYFDVRRMV